MKIDYHKIKNVENKDKTMKLKVKIHLLQTSIHFNLLELPKKKLTTLFPKDAAHDSINQSIS